VSEFHQYACILIPRESHKLINFHIQIIFV